MQAMESLEGGRAANPGIPGNADRFKNFEGHIYHLAGLYRRCPGFGRQTQHFASLRRIGGQALGGSSLEIQSYDQHGVGRPEEDVSAL